jgi:hypothetical protein
MNAHLFFMLLLEELSDEDDFLLLLVECNLGFFCFSLDFDECFFGLVTCLWLFLFLDLDLDDLDEEE